MRKNQVEKVNKIMESLDTPKQGSGAVKFQKNWGNKTFAVVQDGNKFTIMEHVSGDKNSPGSYAYINGVQNRSKYQRATFKEALHRLNFLLTEDKVLRGTGELLMENMAGSQDKFVLRQPAPTPPPVDGMGDMGGEPDVDADPGSGDVGAEEGEQPEFMQQYGGLLEDFDAADEQDKQWLLNSLISRLDAENDANTVASAKEKLEGIGQGESGDGADADLEDLGGDGEMEEGYIVETLTKKAFMERYSPFTEKPKASTSDKPKKSPLAFKGKGGEGADSVFGAKKDPNQGEAFAGKTKTADKSTKGKAESAKTVFKKSEDPNRGPVFEGQESSPFTEPVNIGKATGGIGIERVGENKPVFDDATAKSLTDPARMASKQGQIKPLGNIMLVRSAVLEAAGFDLEDLLS